MQKHTNIYLYEIGLFSGIEIKFLFTNECETFHKHQKFKCFESHAKPPLNRLLYNKPFCLIGAGILSRLNFTQCKKKTVLKIFIGRFVPLCIHKC